MQFSGTVVSATLQFLCLREGVDGDAGPPSLEQMEARVQSKLSNEMIGPCTIDGEAPDIEPALQALSLPTPFQHPHSVTVNLVCSECWSLMARSSDATAALLC